MLLPGLRRLENGRILAQETLLGWILSGSLDQQPIKKAIVTSFVSGSCTDNSELINLLQRFWELEEVTTNQSKLNPEDQRCEGYFRNTYYKDTNGSYVVKLPFKSTPSLNAVPPRKMALASLSYLERRFSKDSKLEEEYRKFMDTYLQLGHMEHVPESDTLEPRALYIPHHPVIQSTLTSWKLRVVFDASRKTSNGECLNKHLMTGVKLQSDLSLILTDWRRHRFVFTADIVKMFRQIKIHPGDREFQRIIWSPTSRDPPEEFRLTTVTYGTVCAPFLSNRVLLQLAEDRSGEFPLGVDCIRNNVYVDDFFCGSDSLPEALEIRHQLNAILGTANINLDKWAANDAQLIPNDGQSDILENTCKTINNDEKVKTLGIIWQQKKNQFELNVQPIAPEIKTPTKRDVLSQLARVFDPLGWMSPVTVTTKI